MQIYDLSDKNNRHPVSYQNRKLWSSHCIATFLQRDPDSSTYAGKEKSTMRHASATEVKEFDKRRMPSYYPYLNDYLFPYIMVNCDDKEEY